MALAGKLIIEDDKQRPLAQIEWTGTLRKGTARAVVPPSLPQAMRADVLARVQNLLDLDARQPKDRFITLGESYRVPGRGTFAGLHQTLLTNGDAFGLFMVGWATEWPDDPDGPQPSEAYVAAMEVESSVADPPPSWDEQREDEATAAAREAWWTEHGEQT